MILMDELGSWLVLDSKELAALPSLPLEGTFQAPLGECQGEGLKE